MEKILLEAALDNGYLNTNNMIATFEGNALKLKTRNLRVKTLTNLAQIEKQNRMNNRMKEELSKERNDVLKKVTEESQDKVTEMEEKAMEERAKLLEELNKKKEESHINSIEYGELYNIMTVPVPKFDKKLVKEYPELEEKAEMLKKKLEKLKKRAKKV